MREIEVKVIGIDKERVKADLERAGAVHDFSGEMEQSLFDMPGKELERTGKVLRIRKKGETSILTLKQKQQNEGVKDAEEIEFVISDAEKMRAILELLGFEERYTLRKHRESYLLGNATVDIDTYLGQNGFVPPFLEIEAQDREAVFATIEKLGFDKAQCMPWDTQEIIEHYKNRK